MERIDFYELDKAVGYVGNGGEFDFQSTDPDEMLAIEGWFIEQGWTRQEYLEQVAAL